MVVSMVNLFIKYNDKDFTDFSKNFKSQAQQLFFIGMALLNVTSLQMFLEKINISSPALPVKSCRISTNLKKCILSA